MTKQNIVRPIKRTRLHEQVARTLSLKILNRELQPDTLLPNEESLSQLFDVSKPVIREAINFMDAKGLVQVRPRIGARVCDPSSWIINDPVLMKWRIESSPGKKFILNLLEVRTIIEPIAAGLAAERATATDLEKIDAALELMEQADSLNRHIAADIQFHLAILEACGNDLLISSLKPVIDTVLGSSFTQFIHSFSAAKDSIAVHRQVADAIRDKDDNAAIEAMKQIIKSSADDIQANNG